MSLTLQRKAIQSFRLHPFTLRGTITRPSNRRQLSSIPHSIKPSSTEIENGSLNQRNLEAAVRAIHLDGLVVVEDAIPHKFLDHLNEKMVDDARLLQARGDKGPFNFNLGNIQQDPPPVKEYFAPSIFVNPLATQITSSVLGPRPQWTFCSANSAMPPLPGTSPARQPVHSDADFDHPHHPFALVINIPLITMTPENGSTELWLGTHNHTAGRTAQEGMHGSRFSGRIRSEFLLEREKIRGPSQPVLKKGSVVIRDLRLWHAGMPNLTRGKDMGQVRVMLAMIHFAGWYRNRMRLQLGDDVRDVLEDLDARGRLGLSVPVEWVGREDVLRGYLDRGHGNSYDFDQIP